MNILVTGNLGYLGPCVIAHLRAAFPEARLTGLDAGYFADALLDPFSLPDQVPDEQIMGDVRDFDERRLNGITGVVHLAGISNDPIGNQFEDVTRRVNYEATVALAANARRAGATSFVFASSCSLYGFAEDGARNESSAVNPLTAYARSKYSAECALAGLASHDFPITCLRFATACGSSPRLRLDLVLNDFVATALATGEIRILSDGAPWRPLINVTDMARAIEWALTRPAANGGEFLAVNAGSNEWNYQVKDLAAAVVAALPGSTIHINPDAQPDKRSYKVCFDLFRRLAPHHQPEATLDGTIGGLVSTLECAGARKPDFARDRYVRLKALLALQDQGLLDAEMRWTALAAAEPIEAA
ncbi:MAG: SDR family oxidoreductase [Bryobacteraceae bacterium]|jgi:nucleoside-diphosphate-sugar epimerase